MSSSLNKKENQPELKWEFSLISSAEISHWERVLADHILEKLIPNISDATHYPKWKYEEQKNIIKIVINELIDQGITNLKGLESSIMVDYQRRNEYASGK